MSKRDKRQVINDAYRLSRAGREVLELGFSSNGSGYRLPQFVDKRAQEAFIKASALLMSLSVDMLLECLPEEDPEIPTCPQCHGPVHESGFCPSCKEATV